MCVCLHVYSRKNLCRYSLCSTITKMNYFASSRQVWRWANISAYTVHKSAHTLKKRHTHTQTANTVKRVNEYKVGTRHCLSAPDQCMCACAYCLLVFVCVCVCVYIRETYAGIFVVLSVFSVRTVLTKILSKTKYPKKERNILRFIKISSGTVISEIDCDCVWLLLCDCIHFVASVDLLVIFDCNIS